MEETSDPETGEPYLKPIEVELLGEGDDDAIKLPLYLQEAYELAEEFCGSSAQRLKGSGFLRTLLLRRVGSTIAAGRITAEKMLDRGRASTTWRRRGGRGSDDEEEHATAGCRRR